MASMRSMTVRGLARAAGLTAEAVRHYVRIGLLSPRRDPDNGYRLFDAPSLRKARFIRRARGLGFTLGDIRTIFAHSDRGRSPCPEVRRIIQQRIAENRDHVAELAALLERMEEALERWKSMPDGEPDGEEICHLIESVPMKEEGEQQR